MNEKMSLWEQIQQNLIEGDRYMYIVKGLGLTLEITIFAAIIGIVIGVLLALIKVTAADNKKMKPLDWFASLYLTVVRGTPMVVQLFIMYYIVITAPQVSKVTVAIIAFGINSGAYVAEIVRAGIMSVDRGQMEAGRSLGLSKKTTMIKIILPQAFKNILPAMGNEFITLIKETSVAGFIGIEDLSKAGDIIRSQTQSPYVPLLMVALIYLVIVIGLTTLLGKLERRLRKSDIR